MNQAYHLQLTVKEFREGSKFHKNFARVVCLSSAKRVLAPPPIEDDRAISSAIVGYATADIHDA
jgi:hypothetical protein